MDRSKEMALLLPTESGGYEMKILPFDSIIMVEGDENESISQS